MCPSVMLLVFMQSNHLLNILQNLSVSVVSSTKEADVVLSELKISATALLNTCA